MKIVLFTAEPLGADIVARAETYPLAELGERRLEGYDAVLLIGPGEPGTECRLSDVAADKLWNYVKDGGKLYAERIAAFDFPSSRLFGWKQDFSATKRTLEKLRIAAGCDSLPEGALLEWDGAMAYGFPIGAEIWLEFGLYRETHRADAAEGKAHPGLIVRPLGKGFVACATFSLFSCRNRWALRPYWLWEKVIAAFSERTGIPFVMWPRVIETGGARDAEQAVAENANWFVRSGILPEPDGSAGVYENIHSVTADVSRDRRPDCHAHAALMFHLYGRYTGDPAWERVSHNLMYYLFRNGFQDTDPASPSRGFFKWYDFPEEGPDQIFTDDNAWVCLVLLYLYRKTGIEAYRERGLMTAEALLETQNPETGLRPNVITGAQLREMGRKRVSEQLEASLNPHFESIAHAAFIQAYLVTGERAYLDAALRGTLHMLRNREKLRFMYSRTSGLSRLVLPLGFLARYDESGTVAKGLEETIDYLLAHQHVSGGIEEADNPDPDRFGQEDTGVFRHNGEGIADQLYTNNFLLMNAWEAWKATGNIKYNELYRKLAGYLCRIQIRSPEPRFHGGWMRAYDLRNGEYFGNNGDTGWGPYCMESGWTNAIVSAGLLLGLMDESIFG